MRTTYRELISGLFLFSLFLFAVSLPLSESFVSVSAGLLMLGWLLHPAWKEKIRKFSTNRSVWLVLSIYGVYLIGLLFTRDMDLALYDLRKTMFIPILTLAIGTGPSISKKRFWQVIYTFLSAVVVGALIAVVKLIFREEFGIGNVWEITFVSHIRFSFQLVLAFFTLLYLLYVRWHAFSVGMRNLIAFAAAAIGVFLFLLQSLIGLIVFFGTLLVAALLFSRIVQSSIIKRMLTITLLLIVLVPSGYVGWSILRFYNTDRIAIEELEEKTSHGNSYVHYPDSKLVENGHYVYLYICEKELEEAWNKRSTIKYHQKQQSGYPVRSNLIRYMTSKGLRKDADGVAALSDRDVRNIEQGMSNYIFEKRFISIYPRIYKTIWELNVYFNSGNPNNMSLAQRIEFGKAAIHIIGKNPLFGVGTGNWKMAFADAYCEMGSQLEKERYGSSHNQFLNYGVKFGLVGLAWILFAWVAPVFIQRRHRYFLVIVLFSIILLANFGDSNLESHMGLSFFMFFYSLFLWADDWHLEKKSV